MRDQQSLLTTWMNRIHGVFGVSVIAHAKDWAAMDRLLAHGAKLEDTTVLLEMSIEHWPRIAKQLRREGEKPGYLPSLPLIAKHVASIPEWIAQKAA